MRTRGGWVLDPAVLAGDAQRDRPEEPLGAATGIHPLLLGKRQAPISDLGWTEPVFPRGAWSSQWDGAKHARLGCRSMLRSGSASWQGSTGSQRARRSPRKTRRSRGGCILAPGLFRPRNLPCRCAPRQGRSATSGLACHASRYLTSWTVLTPASAHPNESDELLASEAGAGAIWGDGKFFCQYSASRHRGCYNAQWNDQP